MAAETGISPTALSLAYLLYDHRVEALPILGISKVDRLTEAAEAMDLSEELLTAILSS